MSDLEAVERWATEPVPTLFFIEGVDNPEQIRKGYEMAQAAVLNILHPPNPDELDDD